jgi:hypothetical protein
MASRTLGPRESCDRTPAKAPTFQASLQVRSSRPGQRTWSPEPGAQVRILLGAQLLGAQLLGAQLEPVFPKSLCGEAGLAEAIEPAQQEIVSMGHRAISVRVARPFGHSNP